MPCITVYPITPIKAIQITEEGFDEVIEFLEQLELEIIELERRGLFSYFIYPKASFLMPLFGVRIGDWIILEPSGRMETHTDFDFNRLFGSKEKLNAIINGTEE